MADLSFHSEQEDSSERNAYDSLTSHTTTSSSASADIQSAETNTNIPIALLKVNSVLLCSTKKTLVRYPMRYLQKLQV